MINEIVIVATKMYLTLGFKSVTMDDVATKMGISKKTIYKYFETKEELIEACVNHVHTEIRVKMTAIFEQNKNAIEENFIIRDMFNEIFNTDGDSPVYQLKKHYPIIYNRVREREMSQCKEFFTANVIKGIQQGFYKSNTNVEYAVLFYYMLIFALNENFQSEKEVNKLELEALKYHTYAIATPKGIKELEKQLENINK
jgi:TetR/AcrR family transcriptional regulator, biofilm operon repressor